MIFEDIRKTSPVSFDTLSAGDCFKYAESYWITCQVGVEANLRAVNMRTGVVYKMGRTVDVVRVNIKATISDYVGGDV